jgi:hypothetical protein
MSNALANKQGQLAPLRSVDPNDVIERYLAEESSTHIAQSLGVTRSALNQWLLINAEPEWKAAQYIKAAKRKEEAEDEIDTAQDPLSLARAREKLRAAQWDLERVCRRIYGQDAPPQGGNAVQININLRREDATIAAHNGVSDAVLVETSPKD